MKLWWVSGESGLREFIFAETEERPSELYAEVLIMSGALASKYWKREIGEDAVIADHRQHFCDAINRGQEGFGQFDRRHGWRIIPLADRIQEL